MCSSSAYGIVAYVQSSYLAPIYTDDFIFSLNATFFADLAPHKVIPTCTPRAPRSLSTAALVHDRGDGGRVRHRHRSRAWVPPVQEPADILRKVRIFPKHRYMIFTASGRGRSSTNWYAVY